MIDRVQDWLLDSANLGIKKMVFDKDFAHENGFSEIKRYAGSSMSTISLLNASDLTIPWEPEMISVYGIEITAYSFSKFYDAHFASKEVCHG